MSEGAALSLAIVRELSTSPRIAAKLRLTRDFSGDDYVEAYCARWKMYKIVVLGADMGSALIYGSCYNAGNYTFVITVRDDAIGKVRDWIIFHEMKHVINGDVPRPGHGMIYHKDMLISQIEVDANEFARATRHASAVGIPEIAPMFDEKAPRAVRHIWEFRRGLR